MTQLIIGFVGPFGSGKSTAARFLAKECNAAIYSSGDVLREIATALRLAHTRENLIRLGEVLVEHFHPEVVCRAVSTRVTGDIAPLVIVEGFRYPHDVAIFRGNPRFRLVAVEAPTELRWKRCRDRTQNPDERDMSLAKFRSMERRGTERNVPNLMRDVDSRIHNDGPMAAFEGSLRRLLEEYGYRVPVPG